MATKSYRFQTYGHRYVEEGLGGELSTRDSETLSMDVNVLLIYYYKCEIR